MSSDRARRFVVAAGALGAVLVVWGALPTTHETPVSPASNAYGVDASATGRSSSAHVTVATHATSGTIDDIDATSAAASKASSAAHARDVARSPLHEGESLEGGDEKALAAAGEARAHELSASYLAAAAYPPSTKVLLAGAPDPLARAAAPAKSTTPMGDGTSLELTLSSWSLTPGDPLHVSARLLDGAGVPVALRAGEGAILDTTATGYHEKLALEAEGDGLGATWLTPDAAHVEGDPGVHVFALKVTTASGTTYAASSAVQIGVSAVRLTGHYQSRVEDGSLVVSVEVQATKPGRAHVALTLAAEGRTDGPRVLAQKATRVHEGLQWIDVVAYGKAMHVVGDGPYVVTQLVLQDTSRFPAARPPPIASAFVTPSYPVSAFRTDDFAQPDLVGLARFIEER